MTRPRLNTDGNLLPGLAAVALFVVFAAAFLGADVPDPATGSSGFGEGAAVMKSLGAALFSMEASLLVGGDAAVPAEGFLASFLIVAVVLDAALDGSIMLAEREEAGENVTVGTDTATASERGAPATDGGAASDDGRPASGGSPEGDTTGGDH